MNGRGRGAEALVALFALGLLLLMPPVLLVFNRPLFIFGVPILYLYIFVAWAGLIGLAALSVREREGTTGASEDAVGGNGRQARAQEGS